MDELDTAGDRRRESDAVVGAVDVVVHRLRDGDHRDALVVESKAVRQGVVAADRDERVEPEPLDHPDRVRGEVERAIADRLVGEEVGHVARLDAAGVRA